MLGVSRPGATQRAQVETPRSRRAQVERNAVVSLTQEGNLTRLIALDKGYRLTLTSLTGVRWSIDLRLNLVTISNIVAIIATS